jgi:hypothetical protein
MTRVWANQPKEGDQCAAGVEGREGMEINFPPPTTDGDDSIASKPKAR